MSTKRIEITVNTLGHTQLETRGFQGSDCQAASQLFFERALGRTIHLARTAEYYTPKTVICQGGLAPYTLDPSADRKILEDRPSSDGCSPGAADPRAMPGR